MHAVRLENQPQINNWRRFYEAQFGFEIFLELYDITLS